MLIRFLVQSWMKGYIALCLNVYIYNAIASSQLA